MFPSVKVCICCRESKSTAEFPRHSRYSCGYDSHCKACRNTKNKTYRDSNPQLVSKSRKEHYQRNIETMRASAIVANSKRKPLKRAYDKIYRDKNAARIADYKAAWNKKDRQKPESRLKRNMRRRIVHALNGRKKSSRTVALIGCTFEELKSHLESQFLEGMTWDNYGDWHVDHIKPCYEFDLTDELQQRECFHFSNLRPLWATDNLSRPRPDFHKRVRRQPTLQSPHSTLLLSP